MKETIDAANFKKYLEDWEYQSSLSSSLEYRGMIPATIADIKNRQSKDSLNTDDSKGTLDISYHSKISNALRPSIMKKRAAIQQLDDSNRYFYDNKRN